MALTKLTEPTVWDDDIRLPQDVEDDCSILSLHPAFKALGGRTRELQAQLTAANTQIAELEQTVQRLTAHRIHEFNDPGGEYVLPANTDISVLRVHLGVGGVDGVSGDEPLTKINLTESQAQGKILSIYGIIPQTQNDRGIGVAYCYPVTALDLDNNAPYFQVNRYQRYASLIYVGAEWHPMNDTGTTARYVRENY